MPDLFSSSAKAEQQYTAKDIEVLEGLEPVRKRPGMYIGGKDEIAMHHLVAEIFDNAMDEAVAGHADRIEIHVGKDNTVTISDNGRGIPVDPHPKFPKKSALEVIITTLHSGGKFSNKIYHTAGGLHGVGISVVNALSDNMVVEVVRNKQGYRQSFSRGAPTTKLEKTGNVPNRRGTTVTFHPDAEIFGANAHFRAPKLYRLAKSKAYLYRGVEIRWSCDPEMVEGLKEKIPAQEVIHFPNGLVDYLKDTLHGERTVTTEPFFGEANLAENKGRIEWAMHWPLALDGWTYSYCNTIPTSQGGTHETGLRTALLRAIKDYGEMTNNKKASQIIGDDIANNSCIVLSLFYKEPQFQGQTKEKLGNAEVAKLVETAVRDPFDHWLSSHPQQSQQLLFFLIQRAEERLSRRQQKEISRKTLVQKLRLPGKLADCTREDQEGTELFIVEGDSAGGSAKQARERETQAILPIRGKILNVASASSDKILANQEINDLVTALGCGTGKHYKEADLRYERVVIMTDADVDGAHIASLLMTFFFTQMPELIEQGHLYLAQPPLYRLVQANKSYYAKDDKDLEKVKAQLSKNKGHIDIGRFKGLGEMTAPQLKETTMNRASRIMLQVSLPEAERVAAAMQVDKLMGKKPELRFQFISEQSILRKESLEKSLDI